MHEQQPEKLFQRFISNTASPAEKQAFFEWLRQPGSAEALQALAERFPVPDSPMKELPAEASAQILAAILDSEKQVPAPAQKAPVIRYTRFAIAACLILLAGIGIYSLFLQHDTTTGITKQTAAAPDIKAPQSNRASITLAGGQTVYLDSVANGGQVQQGGVKVVKLDDGHIAYNGADKAMGYNTLSNPRGSRVIDITLSDGSQIWLDAGSTITYPITFAGGSREVSMTGEAYFEVAGDPARPFTVRKGDITVQVLGTQFNINAYDDEKDIRVTLLKGSVKVNKGAAGRLLTPGQQAQVSAAINLDPHADVESVMAWKNGLFTFRSVTIRAFMRQIARWYDVQVDYEAGVPDNERITGDIGRSSNISDVMKMLEFAGVHFNIDGRKITIKP